MYGSCVSDIYDNNKSCYFSYELIEPKDTLWGSYVDGNWTGITGQFYNKVNHRKNSIEKAILFTINWPIIIAIFIQQRISYCNNKGYHEYCEILVL